MRMRMGQYLVGYVATDFGGDNVNVLYICGTYIVWLYMTQLLLLQYRIGNISPFIEPSVYRSQSSRSQTTVENNPPAPIIFFFQMLLEFISITVS